MSSEPKPHDPNIPSTRWRVVGGVLNSWGAADMAGGSARFVCGTEKVLVVPAVTTGAAAGGSTATSTTVPAGPEGSRRDGAAPAVAVNALARTRGAPVGSSTRRWLLIEPLAPPPGAFASATSFGSVESRGRLRDHLTLYRVAAARLLRRVRGPGAQHHPRRHPPHRRVRRRGGALRVRTGDGRCARGFRGGPSGGRGALGFGCSTGSGSARPAGRPLGTRGPVSSAHATPGVVATAIPTPSATANPPTRPMYLALLMIVPLASHGHGVVIFCAAQALR